MEGAGCPLQAGDTSAMPVEVIGVETLRMQGRSGDKPVAFPRLWALVPGEHVETPIAGLPDDVQFGLAPSSCYVTAHLGQHGRAMLDNDTSENEAQWNPAARWQNPPGSDT